MPTPIITLPHACDTHFHVFGPADRYPYGSDLRYRPPTLGLDDYLEEARAMGVTRYVLVQPSAYGQDNRCMLDAMRVLGTDTCRGIVDLADDTPDSVLAEMDALGVRGVRINVSPVAPEQPGLAARLQPRIRLWTERCQALGWHLDFLLPGWLTLELMPVLRALPIPYTMAHLGMNLAKDGPDSVGFQALLQLLRDVKHAHVKLTGLYRISTLPGFTDVRPMAERLAETAPGQLIWGSDYPHLSFGDNHSTDLLRHVLDWIPDAGHQRSLLVDTPARLFGWETPKA